MKVADQDPYSSNAYDQSVMQYIRPFYIATQPAHKKVNKGMPLSILTFKNIEVGMVTYTLHRKRRYDCSYTQNPPKQANSH